LMQRYKLNLKRHVLKPGVMFKGKGLKPAAFQAYGSNIIQVAPPPALRGERNSTGTYAASATRGLDRVHIYFARLERLTCGNSRGGRFSKEALKQLRYEAFKRVDAWKQVISPCRRRR
jgi:hypothetical protein